MPGWREDNFSLRYALALPPDEVWTAHMACKRQLLGYVNRATNAGLDVDVLTLGFARHAMALNGSFFNTQRMMQQYVVKAYFL